MNFPYPCIDIENAIKSSPPELKFVFPQLGLLKGTVGCINAPGASGKSWISLQLAAYLTCNLDTLGLGENFGNKKVLILAAEDPEEILIRRVIHLSSLMNEMQLLNFTKNISISPCLGKPGDFMDGGKTSSDISSIAADYELIVVDTLSRWHSGQENERKDAACVMRQLELIAAKGPAVIFLHHTGKSTAASDTNSSRGSSVWTDESRWVGYLEKIDQKDAKNFGIETQTAKDFIRFGVSKVNYHMAPTPFILQRGKYGELVRYDKVSEPRSSKVTSGGGRKNGDF